MTVAPNLFQINRNPTSCLNRVSMKENAVFAGDPANLLDRFKHSGLVIRQHDCGQARVGSRSAAHIARIHSFARIDSHIRRLASSFFEHLRNKDDDMVFDA